MVALRSAGMALPHRTAVAFGASNPQIHHGHTWPSVPEWIDFVILVMNIQMDSGHHQHQFYEPFFKMVTIYPDAICRVHCVCHLLGSLAKVTVALVLMVTKPTLSHMPLRVHTVMAMLFWNADCETSKHEWWNSHFCMPSLHFSNPYEFSSAECFWECPCWQFPLRELTPPYYQQTGHSILLCLVLSMIPWTLLTLYTQAAAGLRSSCWLAMSTEAGETPL